MTTTPDLPRPDTQSVDVAVIGGGPTGLALAAALSGCGLSIAIVERQPLDALRDPAEDGREIALTHASLRLLSGWGVPAAVLSAASAPLREARLLDGPRRHALRLDPGNGQPLGLFVPNRVIRKALFDRVQAAGEVIWRCGAGLRGLQALAGHTRIDLDDGSRVEAQLTVCADSRRSASRDAAGIGAQMEVSGQSLLLCRMRHERPHRGVSTAWFNAGRILSILPLSGDRCSVVLCLPTAEAQALAALPPEVFATRVAAMLGHPLGVMHKDDEIRLAPVVTCYADRFVSRRVALAGDAAVGLHPVTAQGFNVGLAGVDRLARRVRAAASSGQDIAAPDLLAGYERAHRAATRLLFHASMMLVHLYDDPGAPAALMRGAGLRVANALPGVRRAMIAALMAPR